MTNYTQSILHDPYTTISNEETFFRDFKIITIHVVPCFRINRKMFSRYYIMYNDKFGMLKFFKHTIVCYPSRRMNKCCLSFFSNMVRELAELQDDL